MPDAPTDLPPPTPELVAMRVFAHSYWRTLKAKDRLRFQAAIIETLGEIDDAPLTLRSSEDHARLKTSRLHAVAWIRRMMSEIVRRG